MIPNQIDNIENKKDKLLKLSLKELRQKAKKLLVPLYSRHNKELLVELILKFQQKSFLDEHVNHEKDLFLDIKKFDISKDNKATEFQTDEEKELLLDPNWKLNAKDSKNIGPREDSNLKRLLLESFPDKKISISNNKDGSQTILII